MTADILLYGADLIPVGKDQRQHVEMARDIAKSFNHNYGDVFTIPEVKIDEKVMTIPGIDGRKMSKSYNNYIDIFQTDKKLKKNIMAIETDSTPLEAPKNPDTCNVFTLYSLLGNNEQVAEMRKNYEAGNYGYGHAKKELLEVITNQFSEERKYYDELIQNPSLIDDKLKIGAEKARDLGSKTLSEVRRVLGY
jgi:tryptophanyl-tRNA synthetase